MKHTRTAPRLLAAHAALALAALAAAAADGPAPAPGVYVLDAQIAPVCLTGTFPLAVQTDTSVLQGSLEVVTGLGGGVTGTMSLPGREFAVTGRAKSTAKGFRVSLTAKDDGDRIQFSGSLIGDAISGTTVGHGAVARGRNTFTLDVSDAQPQVATIVATLVAGKKGSLTGEGTAEVCGILVPVTAAGTPGREFKLKFRGERFRFTTKGAGPVSWAVRGFGAEIEGEALPLSPLAAPSALEYGVTSTTYEEEEPVPPNFPKTFMPRFTTYSVEPSLPLGMTIDASTGVIGGTPSMTRTTTTYEVTAENPAGSTTASVAFDVRVNHSKSFAPETDPLDDDDLRHFLRRTQWGVRTPELDALRAGGLDPYLDAMLVFPAGTQAETDAAALLVNTTDPPGLEGQFPSASQCARWWTSIMVETPAPFQETLAFFWHDHFGVSVAAFDSSERRWIVTHANLLRREGAGNLRTLLLDVARDPAMLRFLDGIQNTKSKPNENFAREFWELFSLGVDNGYTQADIVESARAFTGYREVFDDATGLNNIVFDLNRHDATGKTFLGVSIPGQNVTDDYAQVVDVTLQRGQVAEFVTRKLFEYFCYENPPQSLVDTMAANLRGGNWELAPFLRALFRSEAFFSTKARRSLVKGPLEYTIGFVRSTGLKTATKAGTTPSVFDVVPIDNSLSSQGQRLTQPPTVDGWPSGDLWLAAQGMVERINVAHVFVDDVTDQTSFGIGVAALLPPVAERTADAVVDTLAQLLDVQLSTQDRADLVLYLNTVLDALGQVTSSPFDGSNQQHLDERVRGLLYALAQHPTYHSR
jgi:uncharacterized protein (DUF1800 family)